MNKYNLLSQRFYRFFKYLRTIGLISLVIFLGVTAFNTHNDTLTIVSYIFMVVMLSCLFERLILYGLYIVFKNKSI